MLHRFDDGFFQSLRWAPGLYPALENCSGYRLQSPACGRVGIDCANQEISPEGFIDQIILENRPDEGADPLELPHPLLFIYMGG